MGATKRNFIPVNQQERDLILKIQKSVCDSEFMDKFRINLIPETFDIYTTVIAFMDGIHKVFGNADVDIVNICDLFIIEKTYRDVQKAEKSGNINCNMYLGDVGNDIVANGISGYRDTLPDDEEMLTQMRAAAAHAIMYLQDYAIGGLKPDDVIHIAVSFFVYLILTVDEYSKNENVKPEEFGIEIGSHLAYFKIRFVRKNNAPIVVINVGPALKLTVKSDAITE